MRLGIDLDGVTCDWVGTVAREHAKWYASEIRVDYIREWDGIFAATKMNPEVLFDWCRKAKVFEQCSLIPGALGAIDKLEAQHEIVFVTQRPYWTKQLTIDWVNRMIGDHEVYVVEDKLDAHCDIYLDDSPEVLLHLAENLACVVRYWQQWNRKVTASNMLSVGSWADFVKLIEKLNAKREA